MTTIVIINLIGTILVAVFVIVLGLLLHKSYQKLEEKQRFVPGSDGGTKKINEIIESNKELKGMIDNMSKRISNMSSGFSGDDERFEKCIKNISILQERTKKIEESFSDIGKQENALKLDEEDKSIINNLRQKIEELYVHLGDYETKTVNLQIDMEEMKKKSDISDLSGDHNIEEKLNELYSKIKEHTEQIENIQKIFEDIDADLVEMGKRLGPLRQN